MPTLNEVFTRRSMRRRYEVWFLRFMLADGSGAWWLRYLLMNLGSEGCAGNPGGAPVQVWATWFPAGGQPQTIIQGFRREDLQLSPRGRSPLSFRIGENQLGEDFCRGNLQSDGHRVSWDLRYRSHYRVTLSNKGWIGFSRTPHSDAVLSGQISLDDTTWRMEPLGYGLQGHNCGFRHRNFWTWTHAYFPGTEGGPSTLEALTYEMPFGMVFRKAVLWHRGEAHKFRHFQEQAHNARDLQWQFTASNRKTSIKASIDGSGASLHRFSYLKTNCSGCFQVINNSLAQTEITISLQDLSPETLVTSGGAVLEMAGFQEP